MIRVQINSRYEGCLALESELQQRFGLKIARVLPALNTPPMNTRLGIGAAQSLMVFCSRVNYWRSASAAKPP